MGKLGHTSLLRCCIFYQDKYVEKIERGLNKGFSSLCEWFIDNKFQLILGTMK